APSPRTSSHASRRLRARPGSPLRGSSPGSLSPSAPTVKWMTLGLERTGCSGTPSSARTISNCSIEATRPMWATSSPRETSRASFVGCAPSATRASPTRRSVSWLSGRIAPRASNRATGPRPSSLRSVPSSDLSRLAGAAEQLNAFYCGVLNRPFELAHQLVQVEEIGSLGQNLAQAPEGSQPQVRVGIHLGYTQPHSFLDEIRRNTLRVRQCRPVTFREHNRLVRHRRRAVQHDRKRDARRGIAEGGRVEE